MRCVIFILICLSAAIPCSARIITVDDDGPADFAKIQLAINSAFDGDTIIIADGTYTGLGNREIDFRGKAITVRSENGQEDCIIDCQGAGRGFYFRHGENANSVLEGFTITNGYGRKGGGIYCEASSPTITNCIITGNSATWDGGMSNIWSCPTLTNCTFSGNSAIWCGGMDNYQSSPMLTGCTFSGNSAKYSGGMENYQSSPILTGCTFSGNSAEFCGGMANHQSSPILKGCTFSGNSATKSGGGMSNNESCPTLTNCTFIGNFADAGGGMYNGQGSKPTLTNCTFSGNSAVRNGGGMLNLESSPIVTNCIFTENLAERYGGGMSNWSSSPILTNCTFSGNVGQHGGGMDNDDGYYPIVINCIFWDNGSYGITGNPVDATYSNIEGGWQGEGNIDADPCFVGFGYWDSHGTPDDPRDDEWIEGDYHLLPDSPCINAGDPNYVTEPNEMDLDGKPRILGGRIDMGAYEYSPAIMAFVRIVPRTINLASKGKWISCYIWLPEDYNVADIESNSVFFEREIAPQQFRLTEEKHVAIAKFSREEVQDILNIGQFKLSIIGLLKDRTFFEGIDVIRVIHEGGGKLATYSKAVNPNPADGATGIDINADLSWTAGSYATSHDVYFGTSIPPPFVCNQTSTTFDPGTMVLGRTYYWRIDEVNKWGTATGQVWSFTTMLRPPPPPPPPPP